MKRLLLALLGCLLAISPHTAVRADDRVDFARDVQPVLARHCLKCHGADKQESGLRLDSAAGILRGGDLGAVVAASLPNKSRLLAAVLGEDDTVGRMPPKGKGLSEAEIATLRSWIMQGAELSDETTPARRSSDHWSFQPPRRPGLPRVESPWLRNPIDYFVLARLRNAGLSPSPEARREVLIRRLSLDLLGLPPTPEEVRVFVDDPRAGAYERLVERLLSSPAYGERWGRHWLDLARYADSNGYTRDFGRQIWKYREWVIDAINNDQPFDRFTIDQFAGDMLERATLEQKIATGFHRNTLINEEGGTDDEQFRVDAVADRVATTGVAYLGLTLGCARCHSHKYDPISQREYYQLFAFLNNCDEPTIEAPSEWQVQRGELKLREQIRERIAKLDAQLAEQREQFDAKQQEWEMAVTPEFRATLPGPTQAALMLPLPKRDDAQKKLVTDVYRKSDEARRDFPLVDEIDQLTKSAPTIPTTMVMSERQAPRQTYVHLRGNFLDKGDQVEPAVPEVLHVLLNDTTNANRLDFARWLVDPANPLTPRVIVNRYWQRFFGKGIVQTENDFGTQAIPPTHPQLLDWLACEFIEQEWSAKSIHRLLVTSATYRQASIHRAELTELDPGNRLYARQNRIRLEAEIIRDSALATSGLLCRTLGGPSVHPPQPDGVFAFTQDPKPWNTATGDNRYRRGMYTHFWRSSPYPALTIFDAPNANVSCTRRVRSNTPLQALTLANDIQFIECARELAATVLDSDSTDQARMDRAFRMCLSRPPNSAELQRLQALLDEQRMVFHRDPTAAQELTGRASPGPAAEYAAWTVVARVLINVDEFITRE